MRGNTKGTLHSFTCTNDSSPVANVHLNPFWNNDVGTDQQAARKIIDDMELFSDFTEDFLAVLGPWDVDWEDNILISVMYLCPQSSDLDGVGKGENLCSRCLVAENFPVNT